MKVDGICKLSLIDKWFLAFMYHRELNLIIVVATPLLPSRVQGMKQLRRIQILKHYPLIIIQVTVSTLNPRQDVLNVIGIGRPDGITAPFGGQTPLKLALPIQQDLEEHKPISSSGAGPVHILGTSPDSIYAAEDLMQFLKS